MPRFIVQTTGWKYSREKQTKLEGLGFAFITDEYGTHKVLGQPGSVEIENLEALLDFVDLYGAIIIESDHTIEIYDDDRE